MRMRYASGMDDRLKRFFAWWTGELLGLLPARIGRAIGLGRDRLRVTVSGDQAALALEDAAGVQELGSFALSAAPKTTDAPPSLEPSLEGVALRSIEDVVGDLDLARCEIVVMLAADRALKRELTLPRVPDQDQRRAIEREVERYTPFRAAQVYLFYTVDHRRSDDRALVVEIAVAPRRFVDSVVDRLVAAGAARGSVRVGIAGSDATLPATAGDAADEPTTALASSLPRPTVYALIAVGVLCVTALLSPVLRLYLARMPLAERAAETRSNADEVRRLLGEVEKLGQGLDTIVRAKLEAPSVVRVLDRLTALLPDDTYLDQFNVVGREIEIEGTTRASAQLVHLLESAPMFAKVTYVSPVTRDPVSGAERFHFSIQYAGAPAAREAPSDKPRASP